MAFGQAEWLLSYVQIKHFIQDHYPYVDWARLQDWAYYWHS